MKKGSKSISKLSLEVDVGKRGSYTNGHFPRRLICTFEKSFWPSPLLSSLYIRVRTVFEAVPLVTALVLLAGL